MKCFLESGFTLSPSCSRLLLYLGSVQVLAPTPWPVPCGGDTRGETKTTAKDHSSSLEWMEKSFELTVPKKATPTCLGLE